LIYRAANGPLTVVDTHAVEQCNGGNGNSTVISAGSNLSTVAALSSWIFQRVRAPQYVFHELTVMNADLDSDTMPQQVDQKPVPLPTESSEYRIETRKPQLEISDVNCNDVDNNTTTSDSAISVDCFTSSSGSAMFGTISTTSPNNRASMSDSVMSFHGSMFASDSTILSGSEMSADNPSEFILVRTDNPTDMSVSAMSLENPTSSLDSYSIENPTAMSADNPTAAPELEYLPNLLKNTQIYYDPSTDLYFVITNDHNTNELINQITSTTSSSVMTNRAMSG